MTPAALNAKLAELRLAAARRCGLDTYPAEAIRKAEEPIILRRKGVPPHGTANRYQHHRCRCKQCRAAGRTERRKYRSAS